MNKLIININKEGHFYGAVQFLQDFIPTLQKYNKLK